MYITFFICRSYRKTFNKKDLNHQKRMKLSGLILILGLIVCILSESTNKQYARGDIKEQRFMLVKHHIKNRLYHLFHQIIVSQFSGKRLKKRNRYILRHLFLWKNCKFFDNVCNFFMVYHINLCIGTHIHVTTICLCSTK